jgi:hypothetical protein
VSLRAGLLLQVLALPIALAELRSFRAIPHAWETRRTFPKFGDFGKALLVIAHLFKINLPVLKYYLRLKAID